MPHLVTLLLDECSIAEKISWSIHKYSTGCNLEKPYRKESGVTLGGWGGAARNLARNAHNCLQQGPGKLTPRRAPRHSRMTVDQPLPGAMTKGGKETKSLHFSAIITGAS